MRITHAGRLEVALDEALDRTGGVERVLLEHDLVVLDERVRLHEDLPGLRSATWIEVEWNAWGGNGIPSAHGYA